MHARRCVDWHRTPSQFLVPLRHSVPSLSHELTWSLMLQSCGDCAAHDQLRGRPLDSHNRIHSHTHNSTQSHGDANKDQRTPWRFHGYASIHMSQGVHMRTPDRCPNDDKGRSPPSMEATPTHGPFPFPLSWALQERYPGTLNTAVSHADTTGGHDRRSSERTDSKAIVQLLHRSLVILVPQPQRLCSRVDRRVLHRHHAH